MINLNPELLRTTRAMHIINATKGNSHIVHNRNNSCNKFHISERTHVPMKCKRHFWPYTTTGGKHNFFNVHPAHYQCVNHNTRFKLLQIINTMRATHTTYTTQATHACTKQTNATIITWRSILVSTYILACIKKHCKLLNGTPMHLNWPLCYMPVNWCQPEKRKKKKTRPLIFHPRMHLCVDSTWGRCKSRVQYYPRSENCVSSIWRGIWDYF